MPPVASFGSFMQSFALTWLPVMFFGLMCVVVWLLWRTIKLMPRVKPTEITPGSSSSVTWAEVEACKRAGDLVFTADDVLARVEEHGDLFAPALGAR